MDDRFIVHYSVWGTTLDVDALLHDARPKATCEAWHRGDPNAIGTAAITAGLMIEVHCGNSADALEAAVEAFLRTEASFLQAVRSRQTADTHSGLRILISVGSSEEIPVGPELPASLLRLLGERELTLSVAASVFGDGTA